MEEQINKTKPKTYRIGNIKLAEWTNKDKEGKEWKSYNISKFYKDQNGEYQNTDLLNFNDLLRLKDLIRKVDDLVRSVQEDKKEQ